MARFSVYYDDIDGKKAPVWLMMKTEMDEVPYAANCFYLKVKEYDIFRGQDIHTNEDRINVMKDELLDYGWDRGELVIHIPTISKRLWNARLKTVRCSGIQTKMNI